MIATPDGSAGSSGDINIVWYDAVNSYISDSQGGVVARSGGTGYRQSQVAASAPAGAAFFRVRADASPAGGGTVRFDNFTVSSSGATVPDGLVYRATQADVGTSAQSEPVWPGSIGGTVNDGTVVWEGVVATRITYKAIPILKSGGAEPSWPAGLGASVPDNTILWQAASRRVEDPKCPNSKYVVIAASKVFAADDDIVAYSATVNPLDWSSQDNAGYLPIGLQRYGANPIRALGLYRSNLVAFNAQGMQVWQVDEDPALMALLDAFPFGSEFHKSLSPVAGDQFFLTRQGVRSIGIAAGSTNLAGGDVGMPIDPLVQDALAQAESDGIDPVGLYNPNMGQYWLMFADPPPPPSAAAIVGFYCDIMALRSSVSFEPEAPSWWVEGDPFVLTGDGWSAVYEFDEVNEQYIAVEVDGDPPDHSGGDITGTLTQGGEDAPAYMNFACA